MVSWDTRKPSSSGNARLSHPEICAGDPSSASFSATCQRSSGWLASRHGFGRSARSQARASASVARYVLRPPWRATSRLTVEAERPRRAAMRRIDCPAAIPREISSRSSSTSAAGQRRRATGAIPPLNAKTWWIAPLVLASARAISLAHWPLFQRSQSSTFFSPDNPGRPIFAMLAPPKRKLNQKVLRRSVEPAADSVEKLLLLPR